MKEFNDDMFIVINKKRFTEMGAEEGELAYRAFSYALTAFVEDYERITGKPMNQRYIVCNQDEPYAEQVKAIILGEPAPDLHALLKRCKPWLDVMRKEYSMRTTREITELDTLLSDIAKAEADR